MISQYSGDGEMRSVRLRRPALVATYLIFFWSGAAGLMYEISWSRQVGLLFGHTIQVSSIVLAAYFAGMGIGSLVGARLTRGSNPLAFYAAAELAAAIWACVIPILLDWSRSADASAWFADARPAWQTLTRYLFSLMLLLPATVSLGTTLPLMSQFLAHRECSSADAGGSGIALAYAMNTAGALIGALASTFVLLVVVGVRSTGYAAAVISAACAVASWILSRRQTSEPRASFAGQINPVTGKEHSPPFSSTVLAALCGLGTLGLEMLYIRLFALVFHNSTYTFGAVTAVYLASLALGAALAARVRRSIERKLAAVAIIGAFLVLCSVRLFVLLTDLRYFAFGDSFVTYIAGALGLVIVVIAPTVALLGMTLPLIWRRANEHNGLGAAIGRLTAANSFAAACGVVIFNFVLLPRIGLWPSFAVASALFSVAGGVLQLSTSRSHLSIAAVILSFIAAATLFGLNPIESSLNRTRQGEELVKRWESSYGPIDIVRTLPARTFKIRQNLHYRFGEAVGNSREARQANIPLLLHERPRDVLFLGLGMGLTAGAAIPHRNVERIVAIEMIPEVVEAARYLKAFNHDVVDSSKTEVRIDDARHFLQATDTSFDVIVSDLFVPWESESGYLFTVEHYVAAKRRLKPRGLFCQWVPLYQVGDREFEMIADSFRRSFSNVGIWWGAVSSTKPVVALIGSDESVSIDPAELALRLENLQKDSASIDDELATVEQFLDHYEGDWPLRAGRSLNTDEHPRIEFLAPITSRDRKLLYGSPLSEYYRAVFLDLPFAPLRVGETSAEAAETVRRRRAWRQIILSVREQ